MVHVAHRAGLALWTASVELRVVPGAAARMVLVGNGSAVWRVPTETAAELVPAPEVALVDAVGNAVVSRAQLPTVAAVRWWTETVGPGGGALQRVERRVVAGAGAGGVYAFRGVVVRGVFGGRYSLRFSVDVTGVAVTEVGVEVQRCAAGLEYGVVGEASCRRCPAGGECDGSVTVRPGAGYYRASEDSVVFYSCAPPHAANSCGNGTCVAGYVGPRCSVCAAGYGRSGLSCVRCWGRGVGLALVAASGLVAVAAVTALAVRAVVAGEAQLAVVRGGTGGGGRVLPVVVKLVVSHLQVLGAADAPGAPGYVRGLFGASSTASTVDFRLSFVTCTVLPTAASQFVAAAVVLPVVLGVVAVAAVCVLAWRRHRQGTGRADMIAAARLEAYHDELLEPPVDVMSLAGAGVRRVGVRSLAARWVNYALVGVVVVLYMVFPTVVRSAGRVLRCEALDRGARSPLRVLVADRSVDCDSASYSRLAGAAWAALLASVVVLPAVGMGAVRVVSAVLGGDRDGARALFHFMTGGYRGCRWYWEAVVLVRRAAVLTALAVIGDERLRLYVAAWITGAFLAVDAVGRPYKHAMLGRLETAGMVVRLASFNLLWLTVDGGGSGAWGALGGAGVVTVNMALAAMYAAVGVRAGLRVWAERRRSGVPAKWI